MKIEIDISDFWLEEGELETELKKYITSQAIYSINGTIKERVDKHVDAEAKRQIEESMYKAINGHITACISSEKVKSRYNSSIEVTLAEWVKESFLKTELVRKLDAIITEVAKGYANDLKQRYDLLFASQLVSKMHENGMLKEDVAKLLLPNES